MFLSSQRRLKPICADRRADASSPQVSKIMVWQSIKKFCLPWQTVWLHWLPPAPYLLIKHLHIVPLTTWILWALSFSSLFWDGFLQALLYHGGSTTASTTGHLLTSPAKVTEGHKCHSSSHLHRSLSHIYNKFAGSLLSLRALPEKDGWGSVPRALALPLPAWHSSLPPQQHPREQTWTAREMPKLHIPSFILLPVDGMDIPCYLKQLSTPAHLLSRQRSRDQHF